MGRRLKPEITWGTPPPEETQWDEVIAALQDRPGDWARILSDASVTAARKIVYSMKVGRPPWTPAGVFQGALRMGEDGRASVWARYRPTRVAHPEPDRPESRPVITRPEPEPEPESEPESATAEAKRKANKARALEAAHAARRAKSNERQQERETDPALYVPPSNGYGPVPPPISTTIDAALLEEGTHPFGLARSTKLGRAQRHRIRWRAQSLGATVTTQQDRDHGVLLMTVRH